MPKPNTMAMARICKDVINDEYETIVFVIGEVIVQEDSTRLILKSLNPSGDTGIAEDDMELPEDDDDDEEFFFEYSGRINTSARTTAFRF